MSEAINNLYIFVYEYSIYTSHICMYIHKPFYVTIVYFYVFGKMSIQALCPLFTGLFVFLL
jgi:hypothetical protein